MQSEASNNPLTTNGPDSLTRNRLAAITEQRRVEENRRQPQPIAASIPNPIDLSRVSERAEQQAKREHERAEREAYNAAYEADRKRRLIEARIADSGIPALHGGRTEIDADRNPEWKAARDKVLAKLGAGFLVALLGVRGTGKTQIAVQAIVQAANEWVPRYERAMDIFLRLRATFSRELASETERDVIADYCRPHFLVIDEFQERGETEFEQRVLSHLIDKRYAAELGTLLISNQTVERFKASAGESIVDRLRETGGIIECTWASFRG